MSHRVKNLFALSGSIVGLTARSAKSVQELAQSTRERLSSLARAHSLTFSPGADEVAKSLIRTVVAPFDEPDDPRIAVSGIDAAIAGSALSTLALLLHEFVTNAAKYGALFSDTGTVEIVLAEEGDTIVLDWTERGGPPVAPPSKGEGFGNVLSRIAVTSQLDGEIVRDWKPEGLAIRLSVCRSRLTSQSC